MKMLVMLSLLNSTLLLPSSHPVAIMLIIIMQTMLICVITWMVSPTGWFSFILFLIFIGGLMILFIYITSLAANEKFNLQLPDFYKQALVVATVLLTLMFIYSQNFNHPNFLINLKPQLNLMFSSPMTFLTMMIMVYLLVTLIVAVKVANKMEGPLRNLVKTV